MMFSPQQKAHSVLAIDKSFQDLIRPLFKNEYRQLEANLIADGCREPISVWNGVIVDGHNRYRICREHGIPFAVKEMSFNCREEAIAWICANQLGRRNLTDECRKYLIGKQYESEKIVLRKTAAPMDDAIDINNPMEQNCLQSSDSSYRSKRMNTALRIGDENHISHGTVEKYAVYSKAVEEISSKDPILAGRILSGRYKVSHEGVLALSKRSADDLHAMNERLDQAQQPFARYQTTRKEIQSRPSNEHWKAVNQQSVKDMPEFDPDAEVIGLTLTIPSWSGSINRIAQTNLEIVSDKARQALHQALWELMDSVNSILSAIKEEH